MLMWQTVLIRMPCSKLSKNLQPPLIPKNTMLTRKMAQNKVPRIYSKYQRVGLRIHFRDQEASLIEEQNLNLKVMLPSLNGP